MSHVTDADVDSYHENGFLVVPGLATPDDVALLRKDATRVCRGEYPHSSLPPCNPDESDEEALARYLCIHQPHKISPVLVETGVKHAGMATVLARLIGPDVKCMQSMLFIKPPGFQGQGWHQDEIFIPTRDRSLTGGWIALDDATEENGCLRVIPGSHKGVLYEQKPHDNQDEFDGNVESYGFDPSGEIAVEVKTGDIVFFHGYLLHRSFKNRSTAYRRVLVNHYMNAWSLLPWRLQEGQVAAKGDFRDIIMVAGSDPYEWKGTENLSDISVRQCRASQERQAG